MLVLVSPCSALSSTGSGQRVSGATTSGEVVVLPFSATATVVAVSAGAEVSAATLSPLEELLL